MLDIENNDRDRRLVEAIMAVLQNAPGEKLLVTQLNKAVFYLDLFTLRDYGFPLSQATFVALERGPVIDDYKDVIADLAACGLAEQLDYGMDKPVRVKRPLTAFRFVHGEMFKLAALVAKKCAEYRAVDLSDYSHKNVGWQVAYNAGQAKKLQAKRIDLNLALQQIGDDDDPWMNADLTDSEISLVDQAAANRGESF